MTEYKENIDEIINGVSAETYPKGDSINHNGAKNIGDCSICKEWMVYCVAEPQEENVKNMEKWYSDKQKFWDSNVDHLEKNGFSYNSSIIKALDEVKMEKIEELEGCLLIIKIGTDERPADASDIETAYQMVDKALEGVKGIRVIITHHAFKVEKISLPQLRQLQSSILSSTDQNDNSNPIIRDLEI